MTGNDTIRYGGWALILSALLYASTFLSNALAARIAYGAGGLLATVLLVPATAGLYAAHKRHDDSYRVPLAAMALLIGAFFLPWLYGGALAAGLAGIEPSAEGMGDAVTNVGIMFGNVTFVGTFLLALSGLRTGPGAKWLAWVGLVGSAVTAPWFAFPFMPPILQILPALGFLLVIVWMVGVGLGMARDGGA